MSTISHNVDFSDKFFEYFMLDLVHYESLWLWRYSQWLVFELSPPWYLNSSRYIRYFGILVWLTPDDFTRQVETSCTGKV